MNLLPKTSSVFSFRVFQIRKRVGGVFGRLLGGVAAACGVVAAPSMIVAINLLPLTFAGLLFLGILGSICKV